MSKRYFLLVPTLLIASLWMTSCEESSDDSPLGNLSAAGVTGVNTSDAEEFCCWEAGNQIHFNAVNAYYNSWSISIGESSGYFHQVNSDPLHWSGKVEYMEKDKYCKETVYLDSLRLDINTSESGWNEGIFRIGTTQYEKGENPGQVMMTPFYIQPVAGDLNTLNVSDANHTYIFRFKTRTADDFNSWKMEQMPQGWMNSNGRLSIMIVPILYSMFQ
jgi:hypothetical protein